MFHGKRPADVLDRVKIYRAELDRLLKPAGLAPAKQFHPLGGTVTPGVVYVNSGYVLNRQTEWLIRRSDTDQTIGSFYALGNTGHKTPSQVFALVSLAESRLAKIIAKAGL